ncbi:multidrug ABC transporter [Klebsiella pneumoniae]|uniref:Multidrug ABC transporter n=1 Tax=Klebsiella pneumoniae TaxID=573 RepID=A0A377W6T9_KLEPN|nr:multidrug ABC transporter [Klebsiella pneumoniae]
MMQLYWVALKSIWTKEIHRFMRIWVQTLVPPVITMTLLFRDLWQPDRLAYW